jgi:hypothetical protein
VTLPKNDAGGKIPWQGVLLSVQPRIRLTRSFDQRCHTYLGYTLKMSGRVGSEAREFLVGVGQGVHTKHHFRAGNEMSGDALPVADLRLETVEFYEVSKLKVGLPEAEDEARHLRGAVCPPPLAVYRERGHRRLAARTFQEKCWSCIWGCRMPVEMIVDHGIRVGASTEPRPSVTVLALARSTKPDRRARFPAAAVE